jgi:1-pyrroline-5-carboxylate dehydrogenase
MNPALTAPSAAAPRIREVPPYELTSLTDFSRPENRAAFERALASVKAELGQEHPLVIGGQRLRSGETFDSLDPSRPSVLVGRFASATVAQAEHAVEVASAAFSGWSRVPAAQRADLLLEAAARMRERRHEFSAWMVYEVGKSWAEADADTAEAVDFLEYYAREMLRYAGPRPLLQMPGERDALVYQPLGVGAVIAPWNFPLAIVAGMASAALVAGNTVVLKPASDGPATAWAFLQLMEEVGLPPGVLNFVTGSGAAVGDTLVRHPQTHFIAFTGSKDVGLGILRHAGEVKPGQRWIKRVVAELGGKDAIIVDEDADLDAAVEGVTASAFGYQGQKCSACSRAIVSEKLYGPFLEKLKVAVERLPLGEPDRFGVSVGPVINARARDTILRYMDTGRREGRLVTGGGGVPGSPGYFLQPTVFADVRPGAVIEQEEIFGPVLTVIRAKDYDEALRIANDTVYALTGSVYSRDPAKLERAKQEFQVGNLYLNRKCTGAMVGVHPFGGFRMSGTGAKAGGPDYLLEFLQSKSIGERIS